LVRKITHDTINLLKCILNTVSLVVREFISRNTQKKITLLDADDLKRHAEMLRDNYRGLPNIVREVCDVLFKCPPKHLNIKKIADFCALVQKIVIKSSFGLRVIKMV
jgi:hypothetical protein